MPIASQMKMLRALREIVLGDGRSALPDMGGPKPDFEPSATVPLPRSAPEAEGLSSALLERFFRGVAALPSAGAHALLVARHGRVVAEGYFDPFHKDIWHVTHSLCKSVTGAAVGLAINEGLFGLDDRITGHFSEAGLLVSRRHRAITVRHLLTMRSGISFNEISEAVEPNWLRGIFASPVSGEAGERFAYNSMNSYLLSALVCKTSGLSLMDYLRPRLFEPMGFGPVAWEKSPDGYEKGGWGMYMMLEDMAKFGQLYLQNGRWIVNAATYQLLPEPWVRASTSWQTESDRPIGYGFHCWVDATDGLVVMNGMFGQYVVLAPSLGMVVAMTAGNPNMFTESEAFNAIRAYLGAVGNAPKHLPPAPAALASLRRTLSGLRFGQPPADPLRRPVPLRRPEKTGRTRAARWQSVRAIAEYVPPSGLGALCGVTWRFKQNRGGILPLITQAMNNNFSTGVQAVHLLQKPGHLLLMWEEGEGTLTLPVGLGQARAVWARVGPERFCVACRGRLAQNELGEDVLVVEVNLLEHSSHRLLRFTRQGANLRLQMDEQPAFSLAIAAMVNQDENTGAGANPLTNLVKENDYLHYRVEQLCTPALVGVPMDTAASTSGIADVD